MGFLKNFIIRDLGGSAFDFDFGTRPNVSPAGARLLPVIANGQRPERQIYLADRQQLSAVAGRCVVLPDKTSGWSRTELSVCR